MSLGEPTPCIIDVYFDHLSHVFGFLSPLDLYHVALTCSKMRDFVYEFCSVLSNKLDTKSILMGFMDQNRLLKQERFILEKIVCEPVQPIQAYAYGLLYGNRYRVSIFDVDSFPHAGNPQYIPERFDDELGRNIYHLSSVCWLEIKHVFKNVKPATYIAKIRMQVTEDFHWPPDWNGSQIKFKLHVKEENDFVEKSIAIFNTSDMINFPRALQNNSKAIKISEKCKLMCFVKETGWFDLVLTEPIHVAKETDVRFQYLDVENRGWKRGVSWDYIKLAPKIAFEIDIPTQAIISPPKQSSPYPIQSRSKIMRKIRNFFE